MTMTRPLFELAPRPEMTETVYLVLANENGRLDPVDDEEEEPHMATCPVALELVYRWNPTIRRVKVGAHVLALHQQRPRRCPAHRR
jgi:hypothetical protein